MPQIRDAINLLAIKVLELGATPDVCRVSGRETWGLSRTRCPSSTLLPFLVWGPLIKTEY